MFATGDLQPPPPPRTPWQDNRTIGMLVLLVCILLCLILVVGLDATVFIPFNATHSVTQTWEANHPTTPQKTPPRFQPRQTSTAPPNNFDQEARSMPAESSQ